jgi:hypothetical protein
MMPDQLAPYAEQYPTAPDGWEPLATLPIAKFRAPLALLLKDGKTQRQLGISNLDFVLFRNHPVAWRHLTEGPVYDHYWAMKERNANLVAAYVDG